MSEGDSQKPAETAGPGTRDAAKAAEKARLAAALRANLQRRKAQARGRAAPAPEAPDERAD